MVVVKPIQIKINSTNAVVESLPKWSKENSYKLYDEIIYKDNIYKATKDNKNDEPSLISKSWAKLKAVNPKRIEDEFINTATAHDDFLEVNFTLEQRADKIAFFGVTGTQIELETEQDVVIESMAKRPTSNITNWSDFFLKRDGKMPHFNNWYEYFLRKMPKNTMVKKLLATQIAGWKDYFFLTPNYKKTIVFDIKPVANANFKVTIKNKESTAGLGHIVAGLSFDLGATLYGVGFGIVDYSTRAEDEWGNITFKKRLNTKEINAEVVIPTNRLDYTLSKLEDIASTPCLFLADEREKGFESLISYGFYKDLDLILKNPIASEYNITIGGLV